MNQPSHSQEALAEDGCYRAQRQAQLLRDCVWRLPSIERAMIFEQILSPRLFEIEQLRFVMEGEDLVWPKLAVGLVVAAKGEAKDEQEGRAQIALALAGAMDPPRPGLVGSAGSLIQEDRATILDELLLAGERLDLCAKAEAAVAQLGARIKTR